MSRVLGIIGLVAVVVAGCRSTRVTDYVATPSQAEQDWGDRLHAELGGVRVVAGPAAVFPYERAGEEGESERGRYQLFTRVMVHNTGSDPVDVVWSGALLEVPEGGRIRLVETVTARDTGTARDTVMARDAAAREAGASSRLVERLEPGHRTVRTLIPETVAEIGVGEPMVPLCDGCEYRLVLAVRIGGREAQLALAFRLGVTRPRNESPY